MNIDHKLTEKWIMPNSKILDLGCGDGTLLAHLQEHLGVFGYGLEIDTDKINEGIAKGLNIIEQDLNDGLARFADDSFDTVVMTRALQAVKHPKALLNYMLRVAKFAIVTFPNFAYWQNRIYLGIKGIMPISETLPHQWYNTPNIHLCTFKDFEQLCHDNNIRILDTIALWDNPNPKIPTFIRNQAVKAAPNLLADVAMYRIVRG